MTDYLAHAIKHPDRPVLIVSHPDIIPDAVALLPGYAVVSHPAEDFLTVPWRSLEGRRIDLWPTATQEARDTAARLGNLFTHFDGCQIRLIDTPENNGWSLSKARASGWDTAKTIEYARQRLMPWPPPEGILSEFVEGTDAAPAVDTPSDEAPWDSPIDLWTDRPVPRLKPEYLPSPLREFVMEQSALTGTDTTVVGLSCLVGCAAAIDDNFRLQPKTHDTTWTEPARLWGAIVGDPSSKKSPGIMKAMGPLRKIENRLAMEYQDLKTAWDDEFRAWEKNRSKDKGPPPTKPRMPRLMVDDATVEALSDILVDNPQGILSFRDELSGWFGSMDVYGKSGSSKDRALWLEAYNGGGKRIDRVTRGHLFVPNWSISVLGGIQPDVFSKIAGKLDNDGLLQRFMIVLAGTAAEDEDRAPRTHIISAYNDLIHDLFQLRPISSGYDGPEVFVLSEEAQVIRKTFMVAIRHMIQRRAVPDAMLGYLGKWEGLFARLLCAYHVIEAVGRRERPRREVEAETAMSVAGFMERFLFPHAHEFYDEMVTRSERGKYVKWIAGYVLAVGCHQVSVRDISRFCKAFSKLAEHERKSIWIALEDYGWLRPSPTARINKRSGIPTQWDVNPEVHDLFKQQAGIERKARSDIKEAIADFVQRIREDECFSYDES